MKRRNFLSLAGNALAASALTPLSIAAPASPAATSEAAQFRAARRFATLQYGRIAYVERGAGPAAALFLHGAPLNGLQWRGALERLSPYRRCIAPDFMGLGYSEVPAGQSLAASAQAEMLAALLDKLGTGAVDIVASDSGGAVAQLFLLRYPQRVRSLMLTNCDIEPHSPPAEIAPVLEMARNGTLADDTAKWLTDKALARSTFGAAVFHNPSQLTDDIIEYYAAPLVSSPLRRTQYHEFHNALSPNPLAGIEARLRLSTVPVRMVWGASDTIFTMADARYLDRLFPRSQGIRAIPEGKLFFQEEFPDIIAEEARRLWKA
ncbi:Pimeloyl-ACP methyl ester carboxylesterase [Duganella sp. CF458]|uniref:alpha/beta fold hydrolase n=1 Tax=Duganella sp. CF458 TaxID=1884368 RepID=UPI0008E445CE|nr:alpha/beta hydrolase [Duganella sp. CF458]SFF56957.1 Pimeloyl-ACP methyl ester carboxylesterase [Duganella sp. CF458]